MTVHTVGPDNNGGSSEFEPRNAANIAWIQAAFDAAVARNSAGVVILTHANPGFPPDATSRSTKTGFKSYLEALLAEVQAWGRPVLYVHGDTHTFRVDQPKILGRPAAQLHPGGGLRPVRRALGQGRRRPVGPRRSVPRPQPVGGQAERTVAGVGHSGSASAPSSPRQYSR